MAIVVNRSVTSGEPDIEGQIRDDIEADIPSIVLDLFYPVGTYYETSNTSFDPNVSWGGTWVEDSAGRVTVAKDTGTFATVSDTGGEEKHTLTVDEMPSHNHTAYLYGGTLPSAAGRLQFNTGAGQEFSGSIKTAGGGLSHNNLQPYVVIRRWHRTA